MEKKRGKKKARCKSSHAQLWLLLLLVADIFDRASPLSHSAHFLSIHVLLCEISTFCHFRSISVPVRQSTVDELYFSVFRLNPLPLPYLKNMLCVNFISKNFGTFFARK